MSNINSIESDRELLELAAKAAGHQLSAVSDMIWSDAAVEYIPWNPLIDDGDALRLAVKLNLWEAIRLAHRLVSDTVDFYAATRLAIVRAAAEIERAMP